MRSRYILGRTYYCLDELPRALEMYNEAADCADTTSAECNFKVLSRIHAQSAVIFNLQVQPRSLLDELRKAEYYAWKGRDSLQAIECYSQQGDAYDYLKKPDSEIIIKDSAAKLFKSIGRDDRAAQTISSAILPIVEMGNLAKAKLYCNIYEQKSGLFDKDGNIEKGREVYYYIKGKYYLAIHQLDSAEYLFRKELRDGKDLNNQIAGCKGLQELYEQKKIPDSIAKYAKLSYELNDSAYLLSEMQNIQKFQASYNYNHHKQLAEKKSREAHNAYLAIAVILLFVLLIGLIVFLLFRNVRKEKEQQRRLYLQTHDHLEKAQTELLELREADLNAKSLISRKMSEVEDLQAQLAELRRSNVSKGHADKEDLLEDSDIVKELKDLLKANPVRPASLVQMREVKKLINEQIPVFYDTLNAKSPLRPIEYEVCLLVRCHFKPAEICKLMDREDGYIANLRKGILLKVYGIKGVPGDLDQRIMQIS
jgi:cbb3-type cytochrome oxidase subunit 3